MRKQIFVLICVSVAGISFCTAKNAISETNYINYVEAASSNVSIPTGVYFNGTDFVKVESTWIRIVINGVRKEYDIETQSDPYGNYVLKFGDGQCITIYSGVRTLYYNGVTYSKL